MIRPQYGMDKESLLDLARQVGFPCLDSEALDRLRNFCDRKLREQHILTDQQVKRYLNEAFHNGFDEADRKADK